MGFLFWRNKEKVLEKKAEKLIESAEKKDLDAEKKMLLMKDIADNLLKLDEQELSPQLIKKKAALEKAISRLSKEIDEEMKESQKQAERALKRLESIRFDKF